MKEKKKDMKTFYKIQMMTIMIHQMKNPSENGNREEKRENWIKK